MTDEWKNRLGGSAGGIIGTLVFLWLFSPFGKSSDSHRADFAEKRLGVLQTSLDKESQERKASEIGWEKAKQKQVELEVREKWVKERETSIEERKQEIQKVLDAIQTYHELVKKFAPDWKADYAKLQEAIKELQNERDGLRNKLKKGEKL